MGSRLASTQDMTAQSYFTRFPSRRSVVYSTKGMVACTQPLAVEAGQKILTMGGNAADAAIAVAAALNVTEHGSTGLGGDMFCLYFDASTRNIRALNGSGRSPKNSNLSQIKMQLGVKESEGGKIPFSSPHAVTVPGAAAGWVDVIEKFGSGKLTLLQILTPAIELSEQGFPVSEVAAKMWEDAEKDLKSVSSNFCDIMKEDLSADQLFRAPRAGEILRNPLLGKTFRRLAAEGKKGFYTGPIAEAIVNVLRAKGGYMELSDLEDHMNRGSEEVQPISLRFQKLRNDVTLSQQAFDRRTDNDGVELWEHPPNGQGIVALIALGILEQLKRDNKLPELKQEDHNSAHYLHAIIESLRIAFADACWWVTDPDYSPIAPEELISRPYLAERAKLFDPNCAGRFANGQPGSSPAQSHSDTVYFAVTDKEGNGMSFVNSLSREFGSCIIPQGCGFTLQSRGCNFILGPEAHPNIYKGGKRPFNTIIPALITSLEGSERQLHSVYGVMGGPMQPQGHVQVLLNMEVFGMNPQQALDAPRVCVTLDDKQKEVIYIEEGIDESVSRELSAMGHNVRMVNEWNRSVFGRGQIIRRYIDGQADTAVYSAGSDMRGDGCAMPA